MDKDFSFPLERSKQKQDFSSSHIRFKDDKGQEKKLGDKDYFEALRTKEDTRDRATKELENLKMRFSKNPDRAEMLNKLLKKDE
ncbi:MAG TPA: hypothetical protein PLV95_00230 [Candidatus Pacearchaeota archaeon]|mgnify:FL=1|nr:hypothetical protein [Candidatus Pacearchaeota archaeon]